MRHKKSAKNTSSTRIWTWRPGFAAQFNLPSTWLEPNEPRESAIVLTKAEERVLDRALERWLNEGGRDKQPAQPPQHAETRTQPRETRHHPPVVPGGGE